MLQATFLTAESLLLLLQAITEISTCVLLRFEPTHMFMQDINPQTTIVVRLELPKEAFQIYLCKESTSLGIDIQSLASIAKKAMQSAPITLLKYPATDHLVVTYQQKKTRDLMSKRMQLATPDKQLLKIAQNQYTSTISMPSSQLLSHLKQLKTPQMQLTLTHTTLAIKEITLLKGNKHQTITVEANNSIIICHHEAAEAINVIVDTQCMLTLAKAEHIDPLVMLKMGANYPLLMQYGHLQYYLAPIVIE